MSFNVLVFGVTVWLSHSAPRFTILFWLRCSLLCSFNLFGRGCPFPSHFYATIVGSLGSTLCSLALHKWLLWQSWLQPFIGYQEKVAGSRYHPPPIRATRSVPRYRKTEFQRYIMLLYCKGAHIKASSFLCTTQRGRAPLTLNMHHHC